MKHDKSGHKTYSNAAPPLNGELKNSTISKNHEGKLRHSIEKNYPHNTSHFTSKCNRDFRKLYEDLPKNLKEEADKSFAHWQTNPDSVHFKPINITHGNVWSARVTDKYRAIATKTEKDHQTIWVWFWIGTHNEYETLLNRRLSKKINHLREHYAEPKTPTPHHHDKH